MTATMPNVNQIAEPGLRPSTALLTDHYELTALTAARHSGVAARPAVFETFARRLPEGRRFGVVAGTARVLEAVSDFTFRARELDHLVSAGAIGADLADVLAGWRFSGDIDGYAEGDLHFGYSPVLTVTGTFGDGLLLETLILSILNHDSAIASAAARMHLGASGRTLLEAGGRRTNELAAPAAARAAYLAGFTASSNLEAGARYGVPTGGTAPHAFTLAHTDELDAFRAQVACFGPSTTFLVDTYDIPTGVSNALAAAAEAGGIPGGVRIDSGDLAVEAARARAVLDTAGAHATKITVSGDLDEYEIDRLVRAGAPIDGFLAGTKLVTGSGHPTAGMVYKLVSIDDGTGMMRDVAKKASGKGSVGGRKVAWRRLDDGGFAYDEHVVARRVLDTHVTATPDARPLQRPLMRAGEIVDTTTLTGSREFHLAARGELRPIHLQLSDGPAALDATPSDRTHQER